MATLVAFCLEYCAANMKSGSYDLKASWERAESI